MTTPPANIVFIERAISVCKIGQGTTAVDT